MKRDTYYLFAPTDEDLRALGMEGHLSDTNEFAKRDAAGFVSYGDRGDPPNLTLEQTREVKTKEQDEKAREALAKFLDTLIPVLEGAVMSGAEWASGSEAPKKDLLQCLKYGINVRVLP